jgi:hypothetical protein
MGGIGTEVGLTTNSAHTIGMVKIVYPVEEYISAYKLYYEGLQLLQDLRKEKLDILSEIGSIIQVNYNVVRELFKNYLIKTGTYNEEQFEEKLKTTITSNPRLEDDLTLHVKGPRFNSKTGLAKSQVPKHRQTYRSNRKRHREFNAAQRRLPKN